jgi:hypothetical protein
MLITDFWGGQTNQRFRMRNFWMKAMSLPVHWKQFHQTVLQCDMYFYREVEGCIVKFQTCPLRTGAKCELSSSEDCIKIHELIPNQWQEPIHSNTIKYAWCVAVSTWMYFWM